MPHSRDLKGLSLDPTPALLERVRAGERNALAELFELHRECLHGRIRLMLGTRARRHAESVDYLQGLFTEIAEAALRTDSREGLHPLDGLNDKRSFLRWATSIARNNIRDESRRQRERALESFSRSLSGVAPLNASADTPPACVERADDLERLLEALEELRPEDRTVIELRDLEGLSYREIAERMQRPSEGAAQVLHARAVARLSHLLS